MPNYVRDFQPGTEAVADPGSSISVAGSVARLAPRGASGRAGAGWPVLLALAVLAGGSQAGCGEEDETLTFRKHILPIFDQRCTVCHQGTAPGMVDIENPYSVAPDGEVTGLVGSLNPWQDAYPEGNTPQFNVLPGEPDQSFLLWKIGDPEAPALNRNVAGDPMPLQFEQLEPTQIATLETWVRDGAEPGAFFDSMVRPIFGSEETASEGTVGTGRCIQCHYQGTLNPPDLTNPFGPEGLVDIQASARADLRRVVPGDVENSFMILKVRATEPDVLLGAPMPYRFEPLSSRQIQTVRDWIAQGALP